MKAINNSDEEEKNSTGFFFNILSGMLLIAFIGMVGYLVYSFFV